MIDWFTVAAQAVNFLILAGLLKHFLYDRVVNAMDERERRIQERLDEADRKWNEAERKKDSFENKQRELEDRRENMIADAKREAEKKRDQLIEDAREEARGEREKWLDSLDRERETFLGELKTMMTREVGAVAAKALREMADADVDEKMADVFTERLEALSGDALEEIRSGPRGSTRAYVDSAFELPPGRKSRITRVIHEKLGEDLEVDYRVADDMALGVRLSVEDRRVSWTIEDYLSEIEERALEFLREKRPETAGEDETAEDDNRETAR